MNKTLELLKLFEKFGVKPGKIIGAGDRKIVPIKKPILSKPLNRDYILGDVEEGKIGINTVKNEIEDIAPLFFQKQLNDVEINNIVNNLNYLDKLLNPTNILDITTKAPVKGLESLKPTSIAGGLEKAGKQLEEVGKKLEETKPEINIGDLIKDFAQGQRAMQSEQRRGLTRATARSILYDDIKSGKIKGMTFEQLGSAKDPIDDFRKIYGENALEQLDSLADDFSQMTSADEAAKFAKTRFKFEPRTGDLPETTTIEEAKKAEQEFEINKPAKVTDFKAEATKRTSIDDLIDEYNANQDRLRLSDEEGGTAISYDEFRKLQERNRQIADALENKGISSKIEEEVKPEGIVIPFKKKITEPEEFADGGITRTKFASGGKGKKVLDIINQANKKLKGKKSMETVNPKTGEVTVPDEFVTTADKIKRKPTKEEYDEYSEILDDSENFVVQGNETFEELDALVKKQKDYEDYMYMQYKRGKLDPVAGENTRDRMNFLRKKSEEAGMVGDRRLFTFNEMRELENLERKFSPMGIPKNQISEAEMIKQKYGNVIDDDLLQQILVDDNPQRKAEVLASIDEAIKMQKKGIPYEEIINIMKNTTRTKQAKGGSVGMDYLMGF
jgi:hypothetical protein